jgi:hypothetical protein
VSCGRRAPAGCRVAGWGSSNGEVIATFESYERQEAARSGMDSVRKNEADANVTQADTGPA